MKKRFLVWALALVLSLPALYADIGENFAKGGIGLTGSLSFYNNFYRIADSTDERNYWSLDLSPELDFFVADRVSIEFAPWFFYDSTKTDPNNIERSMGFGFGIGGSYAIVPDPSAVRGLVLALGGLISLDFYPATDDLLGGVEVSDDYSETDLRLYFTPRAYYFLNDRLAPFVGITPRLAYVVSLKDPAGNKVDLTSQQRLYLRMTATVGISWFIPSRNASLSARRRIR
ncbi:MAG: hypothetical protein A2064_06885 [Spirochaetes bacterium GWB1_66_5]|nr:MAG: hypothetical protein A2064_06885 [Spirochaetes bacterium GWB1_66_5]